ncbi:MAG TPA: FmdB family zinc ribbon protein [Thermomicrobiaceae bacterium]|nr:FmdB family zinc ribbon protein [Thermomicrobiaceae bacterium]
MPIYEYACKSCGHRFEQKQSFHDEPVAVCPECGEQVQRVLHPAGIIFKGSGWYITDSRKSTSGNGGKASESKPEGKPETAKTEPAAPAASSGTGASTSKSDE